MNRTVYEESERKTIRNTTYTPARRFTASSATKRQSLLPESGRFEFPSSEMREIPMGAT